MADRLGPRLALFVAFVVALVVGVAGGSAASSACIAPGDGPNVCLDVVHEPNTVTVSQRGRPTYASFTATVRNDSKQTVTHVMVRVTPIETVTSEGFVLFSATPSAGTCSYDAASSTLTCSLDKLARGERAQVELVVEASSSTGEASLDFIASFDERVSDNPESPGKVDTVSVTEMTSITPPGPNASSFVPVGARLELGVTKQGQEGRVRLPAQDFFTTAELEFTGTDEIPFACPSVCRGGDWFTATIPGTFDPLAEFDLFWPANLVSAKQTEKNFAVFYVASPGAPVETISARCDATRSVVPCIDDLTFFKTGPLKGAIAATVVRAENGHMR